FNGGTLYNVAYPNTNVGPQPTTDGFHYNGIYLGPGTLGQSVGYIRNSIFHDVGAGANMAFPNTGGGRTVYVYNNIFYGAWSDQVAVQVEPYDIYTDLGGTAYIANNLFYFPDSKHSN